MGREWASKIALSLIKSTANIEKGGPGWRREKTRFVDGFLMPKRKPGWVKTELSLDTCCKIRGFGVSPKGIENESQHGIEKGSKSTLVAPSTEFVRFYGLLAGADFLMSFQGAQNDILMPRRRVPGAAAPSIREPVPRSASKPGGPVGPIYPLRVRRRPRRVRRLRLFSLHSPSLYSPSLYFPL